MAQTLQFGRRAKSLVAVLVASTLIVGCATRRPAATADVGPPTSGADQAATVAGTAGAGGGAVPAADAGALSAQGPLAPGHQVRRFGSTAEAQAAIAMEAGDRVFFDFDSSRLRPDAQLTLSRQAAFLNSNPGLEVLIAGNADERGTREYNLALGARRANAVRDYLIALGVDARRMTTVSYGKERPIDSRANEEGWARNRNAHTTIIQDLSS